MTREDFVCAALLKYMERREVMDAVVNLYADRKVLEKLAEATLQLARYYTVIESCCERAADELEHKIRKFKEAHKHDFDMGREDLN